MNIDLPPLPIDRPTTILDDKTALLYAAKFEMMSDAFLDSPFPATMLTSQNHNSHWLVVILHKGYSRPEDNGLSFHAFPKTMMTLAQVKSTLHAQCENSYFEIEIDPKKDGEK